MFKKLDKKGKTVVILSIVFVLLLIGGTLAWLVWESNISAFVFGKVCAPEIVVLGGNTINGNGLRPTIYKEKGLIKEINVSLSNLCDINDNASMNLYLELYDFPEALADPTFVWELYLDEEQISHGNFEGKQEGDTITLVSNQLITNTNSDYFLYIYLDGSQENPTSTQNQSFIFKLYAEGRDALYTDPETDEIIVTFDPNGGTLNTRKKIVYEGEEYGDLPTPTRDGYSFLEWETISLPSEYQEVEWIEGKYGPAINTGVNLTLETEIETEGMQGEQETSYLSMYGCANPSIGASYSNTSSVYASFGNISDSTGGTSNWYSDFNTFVQNKTGWWLNGILQKQYNATSVSVNESRKIAVFARYSNNNTIERASWWKIKYFIIRENGIEVSHLIPCYRTEDGEIGMYDIVQHVFRTNVGSGSFIKGDNISSGNETTSIITSSTMVGNNTNHTLYAKWQKNPIVTFDTNGGSASVINKEVVINSTYGDLPIPHRDGYTFLGWSYTNYINNNLPNTYQEVEWIEGKYGPAINTGVNLTLDTEIETEGMQGEYQQGYLSMYGCASPTIGTSYSNTSSVYASFGNISDSTGGTSNWYSDFNTFVQNKTGWWLNGILQKQYNATSVSVNESRKIAVFARYSNNNTIERASWWKIKYFIIRENGIEVSHLIPCYRKEDGEIGMYDIVQHVFRTNVGSGAFIKGEKPYSLVTSSTIVENTEDHTLYAIWEENS